MYKKTKGEKLLHKAMKVKKHDKKRKGFASEADVSRETNPFASHEKKHKKNWIAGAIGKKGALHKELGISTDKKIPAKTLSKAAKAKGKEGKRARLAETLKGFKHGKKHAKKRKMTQAQDDASDKKAGRKEGSKADIAQDKRDNIHDKVKCKKHGKKHHCYG